MGKGYSKLDSGSNHTSQNILPTKRINLTSHDQHSLFDTLLIWVDGNYDPTHNDYRHTWIQLQNTVHNVYVFTEVDVCFEFLGKIKTEKVFILISGSLGQILVPGIHDMDSVHSIYIFCSHHTYHEEWVKPWHKVKCISTKIEPICDMLRHSVKQVNEENISISFWSLDDVHNIPVSTIYGQLLEKFIRQITYEKQNRQPFVNVCRKIFAENPKRLALIEQFDHDYSPKKAIWWYHRLDFVTPILNRAIRLLDVEMIVDMGFLIHDLHQQLEQLHREQFKTKSFESLTVYHGQGLSKNLFSDLQLREGGLMIFNHFLSTTKDYSYAKQLAQDVAAKQEDDKIGVFFVINIDPNFTTTTALFSDIKNFGYSENHTDLMFSMHSVFRIQKVVNLGQDERLFQVELMLIHNDDPDSHLLTELITEQIAGRTGYDGLCHLLIEVGYFEKAEELYLNLLKEELSETDQIWYYEQLGRINEMKGKDGRAIFYFEKALDIQPKKVSANHFSLALLNNNLGSIYCKMGEYTKALFYFDRSLKMQWNHLPLDPPELIPTYDGIASVYEKMGDFPKTLSFHQKALTLREKILSKDHLDLANAHARMGSTLKTMNDFSEALCHYEKALDIRQRILTPTHPDLAQSYHVIGSIYLNMKEYWKAFTYFNKAVEIKTKHLCPNHPDLALAYFEMGQIHFEMKKYTKAMEYFREALSIYEYCSSDYDRAIENVHQWIERVQSIREGETNDNKE